DDDRVRELMLTVLRGAGYEVDEVADPTTALAACADTAPYDLLLTDLSMPGMSGRELADRIGAAWPEIKVLYTSGYVSAGPGGTAVPEPSPGRGVLPKPFTGESLAGKVREALASAGRGLAA